MTKFLTTAAWAALVLGGVAAADTPPSESAEMTVEDKADVEAEAPMDITAAEITSEDEAGAETELDETAASELTEGEASAGGEAPETEDVTGETADIQ